MDRTYGTTSCIITPIVVFHTHSPVWGDPFCSNGLQSVVLINCRDFNPLYEF